MLRKSHRKSTQIAIDASRSNTYGSKRFIRTILNGLIEHTNLRILVFTSCESFNSLESSRLRIVRLPIKQGGIISILFATLITPILSYFNKAFILYSPWDIGPIIKPLPFILGIHSPNCLTPKKYKSQKMPWLHEWLTRKSSAKAIGVEFPSYAAAKGIGDYMSIDREKRKVIHHGAELSKWRKIIDDLENSGKVYHGEPYIIFWSWFYRAKNLETLLEGFKKYIQRQDRDEAGAFQPNERLVCAGKFVSSEYENEIHKLIHKLDLADRVDFIGQPTDEELVELIYHAEAMVIPSLYETFGFMYVEGRVFNKPFIVADTEVAKEVTEGQCLYFKGLEPEDLAQQIYLGLHSWSSVDGAYEEVYTISDNFSEEYAGKALAEYFNSFFE